MANDDHLQTAVLEALRREPSTPAAHIGVAVEDGVARLTGHVQSLGEKRAAEAVAAHVRGVKAVIDQLEVRLPADALRDDEALAAAALELLSWNALTPPGMVTVTVDGGHLTLSGQVDWQYQREAAEGALIPLIGLCGLTNAITIKSKVSASNVSDDIMHALHRSWFFDPNTISVAVDGGTVVLSGTVRSPHDRQTAIATAWAEPGVTNVVSRIEVA